MFECFVKAARNPVAERLALTVAARPNKPSTSGNVSRVDEHDNGGPSSLNKIEIEPILTHTNDGPSGVGHGFAENNGTPSSSGNVLRVDEHGSGGPSPLNNVIIIDGLYNLKYESYDFTNQKLKDILSSELNRTTFWRS